MASLIAETMPTVELPIVGAEVDVARQDIQAGQIDAVIVWHLDRLHRHPKELEEFLDICQAAKVRHCSIRR
jgi:hypothetical protein